MTLRHNSPRSELLQEWPSEVSREKDREKGLGGTPVRWRSTHTELSASALLHTSRGGEGGEEGAGTRTLLGFLGIRKLFSASELGKLMVLPELCRAVPFARGRPS